MRIVPLALIIAGVIGLLKHFGLIDAAFLQVFWPVLLIVIGVAMLLRGPHWRAHLHDRLHERWEHRMHRRFGPGWANLSEDERERFRAGMRQGRRDRGADGFAQPADDQPAPPAHPSDPGAPR